jgi:hypothetical protein
MKTCVTLLNRWLIGTLIGTLLMLTSGELWPAPALAGSNGQQIVFTIAGGEKFTYLRIDGFNQNGERAIWERSFPEPVLIAITEKWWWKGTVVLEFDIAGVGKAACVVENIPEKSSSDIFHVVYGATLGCDDTGNLASGIFDQDTLLRTLEDYILTVEGNSLVQHGEAALKLLEGDIIGFLTKELFSPACIIITVAATPALSGGPKPLNAEVAQICKKEVDGLNWILSKWNAGQVSVRQ